MGVQMGSVLRQSANVNEMFSDKLNYLLARAGYPDRGRPAIVARYTGAVSKNSAYKWLNSKNMPSDENVPMLIPLISHCLEKSGDEIDPEEISFWLLRPAASNPFDRQLPVSNEKLYDPKLIRDCVYAISETADKMGVNLSSVPAAKFKAIYDSVLEDANKTKLISTTAIKTMLQLALPTTEKITS